MKAIKHNFTLVEILVAVAILVIMMGFLFQFTGAAQKVWSANTARTEMSAQADAIFSLLAEDLEHIYIVEEYEDLDAQSGWYCKHTNNHYFAAPSSDDNLEDLCFFTQAVDDVEGHDVGSIYGVRYHFDSATGEMGEGKGKLYRYESTTPSWNKITDLELNDNGVPQAEIDGKKATDADWYATVPTTDKEDYLVAQNIKSIQIFSDAAVDEDTNLHNMAFIAYTPKYIRVNVVFSVPLNLRNGAASTEDTDRTFSRVFLIKK